MIKAIMAVDDAGGVSKSGSMPWPKNSNDLKWFKKCTLNQVVIMGRNTWEDPYMPTPLSSRVNVLFTRKKKETYPGADYYLNGELELEIKKIENIFKDKDLFIIGGVEIFNQAFSIVQEFYLTRIYGNYQCDKSINIIEVQNSMTLDKKIDCDETCHFEIWKK
tara:strand:+ start:277 stop:765 length:489 start_codon:yes stop_codon:yes gene_type:complete